MVAVFLRNINNPLLSALQIHRCQGHFSPSDILRQGDARHIGKHPLVVIGGAAGNLRKLLIVNFACQMLLDIMHTLV